MTVDAEMINSMVCININVSCVLYWTNPVGVFYVGLMILAGALVYFGILTLLKGFGKEEVGFLKGIFRI